ncbi:MAG: hypothetical protein IJJ14_07535 [Coriobacteriales bacterium]|nr:hypothetical protein [Coriobacteriales bacterium]
MPPLITHDLFARQILEAHPELIGDSEDERDAFVLGSQGPDPWFYIAADPKRHAVHAVGPKMHRLNPSKVLFAMKEVVSAFEGEDADIARAYAKGFLCHYELDRAAHPYIYCIQFALQSAGEPDLDESDGSEIHAEIERELDEFMLYRSLGVTVKDFNPGKEILQGSGRMLEPVSKMHSYVAANALSTFLELGDFVKAVKWFRLYQKSTYSPLGWWRAAVGRIEETRRRYSFVKALAHRPQPSQDTPFANLDHIAWTNPFTQEVSTSSFPEIFEAAKERYLRDVEILMAPDSDLEAVKGFTGGVDFNGHINADE